MTTLIPNWLPWSYALRAAVAIILGIMMLVFPLAGLTTFILLFAAFLIADGVLALIGAFKRPDGGGLDWAMLLYGILAIALGLVFLVLPGLSLATFVLIVAAAMLATGIATLVSTGSWRKRVPHPWIPLLLAIFSILFGLYLLVFPLAGVAAIPFTIGLFAFISGALMLGVAYELWYRRARAAGETV